MEGGQRGVDQSVFDRATADAAHDLGVESKARHVKEIPDRAGGKTQYPDPVIHATARPHYPQPWHQMARHPQGTAPIISGTDRKRRIRTASGQPLLHDGVDQVVVGPVSAHPDDIVAFGRGRRNQPVEFVPAAGSHAGASQRELPLEGRTGTLPPRRGAAPRRGRIDDEIGATQHAASIRSGATGGRGN